MPSPTLYMMAQRTAKRNVASITDLADMPWEMAEPILKAVTSAQQLRDIEVNCPHLNDHTGELWQAIIKRDIPEVEKNENLMIFPKNPCSWHKVYRKMKRDQETRELAQEEALRQQLIGDKIKKEEKKALFVPGALAHARDEKETNIFIDGVRSKRVSNHVPVTKSTLLKDGKSGSSTISAIRQRNTSKFTVRQFGSASPAMTVRQAANQIKEAPQSVIRENNRETSREFAPRQLLPHQKEYLKDARRLNANIKIQAPGRVSNVKFAASHQNRVDAAVRQAREVDEAKLRALAQTKKADQKPAQPIRKFDFEPSPPAQSPSPAAAPSPPPSHNFTPVSSPPAQSPPRAPVQPMKRSDLSDDCGLVKAPGTSITGIRKRPPPASIFAPNKRSKR